MERRRRDVAVDAQPAAAAAITAWAKYQQATAVLKAFKTDQVKIGCVDACGGDEALGDVGV